MKQNMTRMIVCMIAVTLLLSTTVMAAAGLNLNKKCALIIDYTYDDRPVAGAEFDLYRVGDLSQKGELSLSGEFSDYPVRVQGLNNEQFRKAADTLAIYALLNEHTPDDHLTTNTNGKAVAKNLKAGLYLVIGQPLETADGVYTAKNTLHILPYAPTLAGPWSYDLTVIPKAEFTPTPVEPLELQVVKVWNDGTTGGVYRPVSVTVHLLRNGEKHETVVLSQSNSWRHEWTDLDPGYNWSVAEEVPAKYTVEISLVGTKFIITNTCVTPPPPTPTPPPIPQTGQVWWPVPVLLLLGAALIAMGILWRKHDEA